MPGMAGMGVSPVFYLPGPLGIIGIHTLGALVATEIEGIPD